MSAEPLRRRAVRAGVYLTLRRIIGLVLSVVGLLYLTRVVGPEAYGVYAAAMGVLGYFSTLGSTGGRVYLVRLPENAPAVTFHIVHGYLLLVGLGVGTLLCVAGGTLRLLSAESWSFGAVLAALAFSLPLMLIRGVPMALLERHLEYGKHTLFEVGAQILFYCVGISIALLKGGVWALVAAHWSSEIFQTVAAYAAAKYRPKWCYNREALRDIVRESLKMSAAAWVYELRRFGISLVLLPIAGERMVGYYAIAERLITQLGFMSEAISRLSVPLYARIQHAPSQLLKAIYHSAQAQVLSFGGVACLLVIFGQQVLPRIFGERWDIDIVLLTTATLSIHTFLSSIFGAQAQAMYVMRKTGFMLRVNVVFILCLFPCTLLFTLLVPAPYKPVGYALGYMLAHQPNRWMLHHAVKRWIGKPYYGMNMLWAVGLSAALFAPFTHYWSLLGLLVFLHPASWKAIREVKDLLLEARRAKQVRVEQ